MAIGVVVWSFLVGILVYVMFVFVRFLLKVRELGQSLKSFPGDPPHWLWGNLNEYPGPNEEGLTWMRKKASESPEGLGVVWFGPFYPALHVFHPDNVKEILKTSEPKPLRVGGYFNISRWLGDGLLLAAGKKWERNRRLLTPAFHFDILRPYMTINNRCTDILINKMEDFAKKDEYFEVSSHISQLTLDIILRCAFSYENDCQLQGEKHPYVKTINALGVTAVRRILSPWLYPEFIFGLTALGRQFKRDCVYVHSIADEVIGKRKQTLQRLGSDIAQSNRYLDFVDILLTAKDSDGQGLTDQEIRDEVNTFLFEGHDTTSSGISWTLHSLAKHPEHQRRCQQEVDDVLKEKSHKDIEWDDLPKLKYLTMCIKEAIRCHTTVPFIQRQTTKDTTIAGRRIPAGMLINIELYLLHHNTTVWENPEEYRPDRFSPENLNKMDPYAYCPFSAGPRNCIGQNFAMHEMKTIVGKIVSRFDLSVHPTKPAKRSIVLVMKSEDGIFLKAEKRPLQ